MPDVQPSLPQRSPNEQARSRALAKRRSQYSYAKRRDNPLAPIAVAGNYPFTENYLLDWALPYLPQFIRSFVDTQANKLWYGTLGVIGGPIDKMEAYAKLFNPDLDLPPPAQIHDWRTDGAFARRWLDGPNPLTLERVTSSAQLAARIPTLDDAGFHTALPGPRGLADELADGKLFLVDYKLLERSLVPTSTVGRDSRWRDKYLPAPVVLLCERPGVEPLCDLVPVAVLIDQPGALDPNPLYLRGTGHPWTLAKLFVDVADFNLQAMSSHIYRHHYVAEPFAVTTRRQLAAEHPLTLLLEPHIRYTIAVNHAAWDLLKKPGSVFDEIYAGELVETRNIMIESRARWPVHEQRLHVDLAARAVTLAPQEYPWRDDGLLWQEALDRYADSYVRLFYANDADVVGDYELQNWFSELTAPDGGALPGLTPSGQVRTVDELIALISQLLFTCGPSHASVHYPQTDYFTYIPMYPGAAYRPPPGPGEAIDEARILATLPPFDRGADQFQNNQIAYYRFDRFGDFSAYRLSRLTVAQPAIARLQSDLATIESTINTRNAARRRPYLYMLPSLVPNSINV